MILRKNYPDKKTFCALAEKHNVLPLCIEILADTETPVSLLKKFYTGKGPLFLLESVEGGERWGRYSFLGTSARTQIRVFRDYVEITDNGSCEKIDHQGDPLLVLKNFMARFTPVDMTDLPRFWGGMTGYITYEMVSFFEKIPNRLPKDKPLAHFMIPEELIIFDNVNNTMTGVVLCFCDDPKNAASIYDSAIKRITRMIEKTGKHVPVASPNPPGCVFKPEPVYEDEHYRNGVIKIKEYIHAGDVIQTVLSQPFVCDAPADLVELYRAQRFINPSPYMYFMHLDETALVGSSPEVMVRLENGLASVRPIAGTRPRGKNEQEDRSMADELLNDEKEKAEHLMLVDLGRNDLGRVAETGTVQVTDLMIVERYSHVMHLVSNVNCHIRPDTDAFDLLKATFPAGTLSGAPKIRAMEIISELEKEPRGTYGGAVGYFSFNGNMDLAITIRTACIEHGKLTVRAGAGIVADSVPETERQETINKAKSIEKALALLQNETLNKKE
ncbi:MAG: chorismate-binding protein [Proteobacteria bacterium]|nr:chorismate-binding protein [Pseudomonadota bacterium]